VLGKADFSTSQDDPRSDHPAALEMTKGDGIRLKLWRCCPHGEQQISRLRRMIRDADHLAALEMTKARVDEL
jgi:hypothetical protein